MDHSKVLVGRRWNGDVGDSVRRRRKRREKRERQMAYSISKLRTIRSVPGINGVERIEFRHASPFHDAHQIQARIGNRPRAVGKANQWKHRTRRPYFGVIGAGSFQGRKGKDDVADGARPNEQAATTG